MFSWIKRQIVSFIGNERAESISGMMLGLAIGIIIIVGVTIPIVQSVIDNSSLTGMTATIVGYIPLFLGVGALVLTARTAGLG